MAFSDIKPYVDSQGIRLDLEVVAGISEERPHLPAWTVEEKIDFVRGFRNTWLERSDWTTGNDSPLSDEQKAAWTAYRQELRNMMNVDDIDDVVIPTPPDVYIIHPEYLEPE
jgi:hypothetical protein